MATRKKETETIEKTFEQIEEIIGKLEAEETTLLDAVALYGDGVKLVKHCEEMLDQVEKQIIILEEGSEE
ncbi:MAG: exodeoxyribonuclease VII small subunit [Lachnospiraceae bacterium]